MYYVSPNVSGMLALKHLKTKHKQNIHRHQTLPRYRNTTSGSRLRVQPSMHHHTAHYGQTWRQSSLPVYFGYLKEGHKDMLKRVLKKAYRMGFTFQFHDLDDFNEIVQYNLFRSSRSQQHCLNHLYTVKSRSLGAMQLRTWGHDFVLPTIKYEFNKRHFIVRSLFSYV